MSAIKERILGAITIMSDSDATTVWNFISNRFSERSWDNIEEVTPDEWDLKMLREIEDDSECQEFMSFDKAMQELGL